jgi:hypothetical protein
MLLSLFVICENAKAQTSLFYTETYTTVTLDTVAVAGSTNAGSDWFTNPTDKPYNDVWLEAYNGTKWLTFKVAYDCKNVTKFKAYHYGADSTIAVRGYVGTKEIDLPLWSSYSGYVYSEDLGVTAAWYFRFRGIR